MITFNHQCGDRLVDRIVDQAAIAAASNAEQRARNDQDRERNAVARACLPSYDSGLSRSRVFWREAWAAALDCIAGAAAAVASGLDGPWLFLAVPLYASIGLGTAVWAGETARALDRNPRDGEARLSKRIAFSCAAVVVFGGVLARTAFTSILGPVSNIGLTALSAVLAIVAFALGYNAVRHAESDEAYRLRSEQARLDQEKVLLDTHNEQIQDQLRRARAEQQRLNPGAKPTQTTASPPPPPPARSAAAAAPAPEDEPTHAAAKPLDNGVAVLLALVAVTVVVLSPLAARANQPAYPVAGCNAPTLFPNRAVVVLAIQADEETRGRARERYRDLAGSIVADACGADATLVVRPIVASNFGASRFVDWAVMPTYNPLRLLSERRAFVARADRDIDSLFNVSSSGRRDLLGALAAAASDLELAPRSKRVLVLVTDGWPQRPFDAFAYHRDPKRLKTRLLAVVLREDIDLKHSDVVIVGVTGFEDYASDASLRKLCNVWAALISAMHGQLRSCGAELPLTFSRT